MNDRVNKAYFDCIVKTPEKSSPSNKRHEYLTKSSKLFNQSQNTLQESIIEYINNPEKVNSIENLPNILYLIDLEKHKRSDYDLFKICQLLIKTDLFKNFKSMKLEENTFINLLILIATSSELESYNKSTYIYKIGDLAEKFYIILNGNVSVHKAIEEKKTMTQIEYLDHLKALHEKKDKIIMEKTISANNNLLYINKIEEDSEIRNLLIREGTAETKLNFSIFNFQKTSELKIFKDFGDRSLETKNKKQIDSILSESNETLILAIDESIYCEKISKELNNFRMRESKFLNENFFLNEISRFNFNKIFDLFRYKEYKKGEILISDKEKKIHNCIYFLREGILDVSINLTLIELITLIKDLVYKRDYFIRDFFHSIDLDMKNQPEKFMDEFKKKKNFHLFCLTSFDVIGLEQLYFKKYDLYNVSVISEIAKVYILNLDELKKIFVINKNSNNCFNSYVKKKMKNLIVRLISCKDIIIKKLDSNDNNNDDDYQNKKYGFDNNSLRKNFVISKACLQKKFDSKKFLTKNISNQKSKKFINKRAVVKKIIDEPKKYKIIDDEDGLNILYKNHKSPSEYSKQNDKLFTLLNTSSKYKIPNIEKIIEEEVEKMNKPLSEIRRDQLNLKRNLNAVSSDKKNNSIIKQINMSKDKSIDEKSSIKYTSPQNLRKNNINNLKKFNDEFKREMDRERLQSAKTIQFPSNNKNVTLLNNYNEAFSSRALLNPTQSINSKRNFKNLENILKNEHLNCVISRTKNMNHSYKNKNIEFSNNLLNTVNSFMNFDISTHSNVYNSSINLNESPLNIFNVLNKNFNTTDNNLINASVSTNKIINESKYTSLKNKFIKKNKQTSDQIKKIESDKFELENIKLDTQRLNMNEDIPCKNLGEGKNNFNNVCNSDDQQILKVDQNENVMKYEKKQQGTQVNSIQNENVCEEEKKNFEEYNHVKSDETNDEINDFNDKKELESKALEENNTFTINDDGSDILKKNSNKNKLIFRKELGTNFRLNLNFTDKNDLYGNKKSLYNSVEEEKNPSNNKIQNFYKTAKQINSNVENKRIKVDKKTSANFDCSKKLINLENNEKGVSVQIELMSRNENQNNGNSINFSNSIINNKILSLQPKTNQNINEINLFENYNLEINQNVYFPKYRPIQENQPDLKKIDESNYKRLGLKTVKIRIGSFYNNDRKQNLNNHINDRLKIVYSPRDKIAKDNHKENKERIKEENKSIKKAEENSKELKDYLDVKKISAKI